MSSGGQVCWAAAAAVAGRVGKGPTQAGQQHNHTHACGTLEPPPALLPLTATAQPRQGLFNRHEEIRLALRFFLAALHKHKQAGSVPDRARVLHDFVRYKGLRPVVERLSTPGLQPKAPPAKGGRQ
jgi:hypothetical protein